MHTPIATAEDDSAAPVHTVHETRRAIQERRENAEQHAPGSKPAIEAALTLLQRTIKKARKNVADFQKASADLDEITAKLHELGEPSYDDDAAIQAKQLLLQKHAACSQHIDRLNEASLALSMEMNAAVVDACVTTRALLHPIYERRVETIASALLPFHKNKDSAIKAAKRTDPCRAALLAMEQFTQHVGYLADSPLTRYITKADKVLRVLQEGLKSSPDWMQFLPAATDAAPAGSHMA
jgi:hypothetical protein